MSILRTGTATFKGAHVNTKESKQGCFNDTILTVCFEVASKTIELYPIDNFSYRSNKINQSFSHLLRSNLYVKCCVAIFIMNMVIIANSFMATLRPFPPRHPISKQRSIIKKLIGILRF